MNEQGLLSSRRSGDSVGNVEQLIELLHHDLLVRVKHFDHDLEDELEDFELALVNFTQELLLLQLFTSRQQKLQLGFFFLEDLLDQAHVHLLSDFLGALHVAEQVLQNVIQVDFFLIRQLLFLDVLFFFNQLGLVVLKAQVLDYWLFILLQVQLEVAQRGNPSVQVEAIHLVVLLVESLNVLVSHFGLDEEINARENQGPLFQLALVDCVDEGKEGLEELVPGVVGFLDEQFVFLVLILSILLQFTHLPDFRLHFLLRNVLVVELTQVPLVLIFLLLDDHLHFIVLQLLFMQLGFVVRDALNDSLEREHQLLVLRVVLGLEIDERINEVMLDEEGLVEEVFLLLLQKFAKSLVFAEHVSLLLLVDQNH